MLLTRKDPIFEVEPQSLTSNGQLRPRGRPRSASCGSTRGLTCGVHLPEQPPALGVEGHPRAPLQLLGRLGGWKRVALGQPGAFSRRCVTASLDRAHEEGACVRETDPCLYGC